MYQTLHCVSLRTVKYDDRRAMVSAWSVEAGRVSLTVPDGASREARRRRAMLMPLSLFEGEADVRPGREVLTMRDMRPTEVLPDISADPAKSVVAMFLAEVLERVLREAQADPLLSAYITGGIRRLDRARRGREAANFPIVFLYGLGRFLGIEPDWGAWRRGAFFDMASATFKSAVPLDSHDVLDPVRAAVIPRLARMDFDVSRRLGLPRAARREMLDSILRYYSLHHTPLDGLRSLAVVSEIF